MAFNNKTYKEISNLVKTLKIEDKEFDLNGIPCNLLLCPSKNENNLQNGTAAEYHNPSRSYDIYLWEDIEEKIQRPLIFHELVEIVYREDGFGKTSAHNETMPWEKKFCEDYLTNLELNKYLNFKKDQGINGFETSNNNNK